SDGVLGRAMTPLRSPQTLAEAEALIELFQIARFRDSPAATLLGPDFTGEENIRLPSWSLKIDGAEQRLEWIFTLMPEIPKFRDRRALELSGGPQKVGPRARALMAGRRVLLLDEPFEGLAPALARRLGEVLANLKAEGVSVLIA